MLYEKPKQLLAVDYFLFYMHQTSGESAGICLWDHTHQMEKTEDEGYA